MNFKEWQKKKINKNRKKLCKLKIFLLPLRKD